MRQIIHIHPDAPPKPEVGAPCNGCGVCCLAEPCPVGMVVSLKRRGACKALRWVPTEHRYRCGMLMLGTTGPPRWWARPLHAWMRRWISAGSGCDAWMAKE
jgi:hypothetical protein